MNWYNVSIGQGQEIVKLLTADLERLDKEIYLCSVIFKKPIEYFETMPREQLLKWINKTGFTAEYPDPKLALPFRHGLTFYRFKTQARQLSKQEFVALQAYADKGVIDNLHSILAILSTPYRFGRRRKNDFEKTGELFRQEMSFGLAYGYAVFFSAYYPTLLEIGLQYLKGVQKAANELTRS